MTQHDISRTPGPRGLAILAGAGPGDEGLITAAAAGWLSRAECVVYDRLANPALLKLAPAGAELIYVGKWVGKSVGKSPHGREMTQEQINRLLVEKVSQGKIVVRLKGGDPLVFGRGSEEADALRRAGLDFRIVPGVTAAIAAGAYAGIPLTDRRVGPTLALVTGHEDETKGQSAINWRALAGIDTVVFYMGVGNLPAIAQLLIEAGKSPQTPVAVVHQASTPAQKTVAGTLATIARIVEEAAIQPPSIIIVGQVVAFRPQLAWFERLPLFGKTVMVTRSRKGASALAGRLSELGAAVIESPTIEIHPADDPAPIDSALSRMGEFDWVVFTSPNGVDAVFDRLAACGLDARVFAGRKIAAVGPGTAAALYRHGLRADLVPAEFTTEALGEAMTSAAAGLGDLAGKKVLLARADIATPLLPAMLRQAGAGVEELTAYRTLPPASLPPEAVDALRAGKVDWITFTSSSTVDNFLALIERHRAEAADAGAKGEAQVATAPLCLSADIKLAAIGPVTAQSLRSHGYAPAVVADPHTIDALVKAMAGLK